MIRVYAIYSRTTLFDITFEQAQPDRTLVKYRCGYDGYGIQDQTWDIILSATNKVSHQSKNLLERLGRIIEMGQQVAKRTTH